MQVSTRIANSSAALLEPARGAAPALHPPAGLRGQAGRMGFASVVLFYVLYFFRPEDFSPHLAVIPFEKIVGGLAALALLGAVLANRLRATRELKLLLAFLGLLCLSVPFSVWRGGSMTQVEGFAKCILILVATLCTVDSLARLRRVLFIPTLAMLFMAFMALSHPRHGDRMFGIGSMFNDPNYFALYLCMILPLCIYFGLTARSTLRKLFWSAGAILALLAIVSTFSRGGFLALVATVLALAIMFRGKMRALIVFLIVAGGLALAAMPGSSYMRRLSTILHPSADQTGSAQIREALLHRSVQIALEHPLLGIGPGEFQVVSGSWHTSHNTYLELGAEAGIPALAVFLAILWQGFKNLHRLHVEQPPGEIRQLAGALLCSLIGYLVGALFLSTAYWLMPYLFVTAAALLASVALPGLEPARSPAAAALRVASC
ncbi:MAG: O-antigen ligase family protein [Terriglobales bacterium]